MAGKHQAQHVQQSDRRGYRNEPRASRRDVYEEDRTEYRIEREKRRQVAESEERDSAPVQRPVKKKKSLLKKFLFDCVLTCIILVTFAFFHHVLPRMTTKVAEPIQINVPTPTPAATETQQTESIPESTAAPEATPEPTAEPEPTVDPNLTPWQIKFADKFTDEVIQTANSYSSPEISITIETHAGDEYGSYLTYYVADIYIAQIENFQTYFATGEFGYYASESPLSMDLASNAILAVNGDYCNNQYSGLLVRNGNLYMSEQTENDICVLYYDGTMETYGPTEYISADIIAGSPFQTWKFGPALLDKEGKAKTEFLDNQSISVENPRCGLGYYEPGHYCLIVCDGRQSHSVGATIQQFAKMFEDLGCARAYNMDGGASAVMTFDNKIYNQQSNGGRDPGDMIVICEVGEKTGDNNG